MTAFMTLLRAFVYLQAVTAINLIRQRLRRLRQPRYLIGALAGVGYILLALSSYRWSAKYSGDGHVGEGSQAAVRWLSEPAMRNMMDEIAAFVFLNVVLMAWILPSGRAALRFSEAEIAFLFPAPLTRRTLIHYRLLRSQLGILFSALVVSFISRGIGGSDTDFLLHAIGWWLTLSILRLHLIAASFGREWLLDLGVSPWLRRGIATIAAVALFGATLWWALRQAAPPSIASVQEIYKLRDYFAAILSAPPLSWALIPFGWLVAPMVANDLPALLRALPASLALLILHYLWVLRFDTAFEEASIEAARRQAAQVSAANKGQSNGWQNRPQKPRPAPFQLAPTGLIHIAFLWKGLIALGSLYRLRVWLIACSVTTAGLLWLSGNPVMKTLLAAVGASALSFGVWLFLAGPMFMQKNLERLFEHLDVLKTYPLPGKHLVLGELATPIVVITAVQWLMLLIGGLSLWPVISAVGLSHEEFLLILVALAILSPVVCGLMLCVPFTGMLLFPAWLIGRPGENRSGIEVMGQRMVFFAGYFLVLILVLLPALLLSMLVFIVLHAFGTANMIALGCAAVTAFAVVSVEWQLVVIGLGRRLDRLDISLEQLNY
jgi:ABC-2 type transport system permease protein